MRIAVNTRLLLSNKLEGIGWFTFENLKRITQTHPEHHFYFIFDRPYSDEFIFSENITPIVVFPPTRHPILWYFWFEWRIPSVLKKLNADLFLSPDGWISLRSKVKTVNVIHDINFEHFPEYTPFVFRWYYRHFFPKYARKADRLATVSSYSKQDIVNTYSIDSEKIDVVYNGSHDLYIAVSEETKQQTREQFTNGRPYFIFVGALHQRKNITNLFRAFDLFRKEDLLNHKLMIVGSKMWWKGEMQQTYDAMQYKKDVVFTERLEPEILNRTLGSSVALMYVSYFEGFGIPIIEAFYSETAVITSTTTSMPEVAGDAALYAHPENVAEIAHQMKLISTNPELRKTLIEKGKIQRQKFSWNMTAENLWKTVEKVMKV